MRNGIITYINYLPYIHKRVKPEMPIFMSSKILRYISMCDTKWPANLSYLHTQFCSLVSVACLYLHIISLLALLSCRPIPPISQLPTHPLGALLISNMPPSNLLYPFHHVVRERCVRERAEDFTSNYALHPHTFPYHYWISHLNFPSLPPHSKIPSVSFPVSGILSCTPVFFEKTDKQQFY